MNNTNSQAQSIAHPRPWYKEFWFWFVLTPILTVIVVSAITVTIAISGADQVVDGPYQKRGRMLYLNAEDDLQKENFNQQDGKIKDSASDE